MNRRHRRLFMTSTPTTASETNTNSVMEIERQANNGWLNATQSETANSELGSDAHELRREEQEINESDNQQMSTAERKQFSDAQAPSQDKHTIQEEE